jgi:hypothetical protein
VSEYTKSTNFASKDSLPSGDPLKIVKGTEINTEFDNIATAVATKADLASPTFTGTPLAPTASSGTNTTQLATTAFVTAALSVLYPVGTIYSNISVSTNPATLFGFGTWVAITGRVVVGLDSGDAAFDTVGETGGSKDAIVVSHTHTDSGHSHSTYGNESGYRHAVSASPTPVADGTGVSTTTEDLQYNASSRTDSSTANISTTGSSGTNANLQPYVVAYVWKRTA